MFWHPEPVTADIESLFDLAGCTGQVCVQTLDGSAEVGVNADQPAVSASVFKIAVALEAETQFADGQLDPAERVTIRAAGRTPGNIGYGLYQDDVETSLRDLVTAMITISDNPATDALLDRIGIDTVNARTAKLGLTGTLLTENLRTLVHSIGRDAGFADWPTMWAWNDEPHSAEEEDQVIQRIAAARAVQPESTNRTTARDMALLLRLIWAGQAGPAVACARVRQLMGLQLTKHRLASGFRPPAKVLAKSGSLVGVVRNEVGVIEYPGGRGYAAAVFCRAKQPWQNDAAINAVIGDVASAAVATLAEG
jgi:beta-lactamase class A